MNKNVTEYGKNYLEFVDGIYDYIHNLTVPLKTYFNISNFGYLRIYVDSRYCYFANNKGLMRDYINVVNDTNIFFKQFLYFSEQNYRVILWPDKPTHYSMELYEKHGYWNGITFMKDGPDYVDLWWFAPDIENNRVRNFLIKNMNVLSKFISYFEQKTKNILFEYIPTMLPIFSGGADLSLVKKIHSQDDSCNEDARINDFLKSIRLSEVDIGWVNNKHTTITKREVDCLELLANGLQYKEIANSLSLSPRTVEFYFENIKNKTGAYHRSNLVSLYNESIKKFRF